MQFARICAAMHCYWSVCEQQTPKLDIAVTQACCQAVVCTAALINEGCILPGSVLQCTVTGQCASSISQT